MARSKSRVERSEAPKMVRSKSRASEAKRPGWPEAGRERAKRSAQDRPEERRERAQRSEPRERPAFAPKALRRGLAVAFSGGGSEPSKRLARERVAESEG